MVLYSASASDDGSTRIWDTQTKKLITTFYHNTSALSVNFDHKKNKFVCGLADGNVIVYDLVTEQKLSSKKKHSNEIWSVLFPDEKDILFCSGSVDKTIRLWDSRTYKPVTTLSEHSDSIQQVAGNPDKQKIVSVSCDKTIKIWDLRILVSPIQTLRNDLLSKSTIQDMLLLEKSTDSSISLNKDNPLKILLKKFLPDTQTFLFENKKIKITST